MRKYFFVLITCFSFLISGSTEASVESGSSLGGDKPKIEEKLCDIRLVFCNTTAVALAAFAIVFVGFLILAGKLHWTFIIIVVAGIFVFTQAHEVTETMSSDPNFSVHQKCECNSSAGFGPG